MAHMKIQRLNPGQRVRLLVAVVLVFSAVAAGLLWWQSQQAQAELRQQVLRQAEQRSTHLADAMAGQIGGVIGALDLALHELRVTWLEQPGRFGEHVRNVLRFLPKDYGNQVTVLDRQGRVVFNSQNAGLGINLSDRAFFRELSDGRDRMVIGTPVLGRLTQQWVFVVALPVLRNGEFDGTIQFAVPTESVASRLLALRLTPRDVVVLLHQEGDFLARSHNNASAMGQRANPDRPFLQDRNQTQGVFRAQGSLDQSLRTFGWHRLPNYGAVLMVGLADESVLEPLAPSLERSRRATLLQTAMLLLGGGAIAWLIWRLDRGRRVVEETSYRLKEAQRLARLGSWTWEQPTGRLHCSEEMHRILEHRPEDGALTLAGVRERIHPDDVRRVEAAFEGSLVDRQQFQIEHRLAARNGAEKHVRVIAFSEYEGERLLRIQGTVQDITEMRNTQLALQQLNQELEKRVVERTRALAELNRELDTFSYSVSHDLRAPLRGINGFASLLAEESERLSSEGRLFLRRIQDSARRMSDLINDLLSMAQHGRAPVRHERVNLSGLARALAGELERGEPGRQVQWVIEDGLFAEADPKLMRVVLQNLLGNAWKYTGQQPHPCIELSRTECAGGVQTFCVRDNGAGFDMAYASQLFQPFKRLHGESEFEGTGVGLATVQRVLQRHGGSVRGEGAVGKGAAFYFSLPEVAVAAELSTW